MMSKRSHILLIDDDFRLRDLLRRFLEESGFRVTNAESSKEARAILNVTKFDLIILDVMMPGETGIEFLISIRKKNNIPVLFLTAMGETEDRINGLEAGADDYLSKPFEPRELILRISKILSRENKIGTNEISFGDFLFDKQTLVLKENKKRIYFTTAEQDLFLCFANLPNKIMSRKDVEKILGGRMFGRSIDVAISRLRIKLEKNPKNPVYLQNIRGKGWILKTD